MSVLLGAILALPTMTHILSKRSSYPVENIIVSIMSNAHIAHAVAAAWMTLLLTGTWRVERGWIDQMGRALGFFWLLSLVFLSVLDLL